MADQDLPYGRTPNGHPRRKTAMSQIIEMQQTAFEMAKDTSLKEAIRCFAMRSFCTLQEERRKLEMRPLPKPVDVSKLPGKLARARQLRPASDLEELPPSSTNQAQSSTDKA